jgi:hypothetical protein
MPRGIKPYLGGLLAAAFLLLAPGVAAAADETTTTVSPPGAQPVHGQAATLTATVDDKTTPATVPTG